MAPSSFPVAVQCWGLFEIWAHSAPHPTRVIHCLLTLEEHDIDQYHENRNSNTEQW